MVITEFLIEFALEKALSFGVGFIKKGKLVFKPKVSDVENALANHTNDVQVWSSELVFKDMVESRSTLNTFVDIDVALMPKRQRIIESESIREISSQGVFKDIHNHLVILGQPGAGKTTLMKYWCQSIVFNKEFYSHLFNLPIVVRLREFNERSSYRHHPGLLISRLFSLTGLNLEKENPADIIDPDHEREIKERILIPFLNSIRPLIIFDGLDEASLEARDYIIEDFKRLALKLSDARLVLTSRTADYNSSIERVNVLEICPLSDSHIFKFANQWLRSSSKADDFLRNLRLSPFADTAIRPLTIAHLCVIYDRVGKIPDRPKTIYKKIINLLLEDWDQQRDIVRTSSYAHFEIDRKFEFLSSLAFEITVEYGTSIFSEYMLRSSFDRIKQDFNLEHEDPNEVVKELESHTGLLLESSFKHFEFVHKSLQEFLCAEYLVKLPSIPRNQNLFIKLPNELAIAVTISSKPSEYFCDLILNRIDFEFSIGRSYFSSFVNIFINRLMLEKPDFNYFKDLSLALVVLYTLYRTNPSNELALFSDHQPAEFEKFIEQSLSKSQKFRHSVFYEKECELKNESGETIIKLKRLELRVKNTNEEMVLPRQLFVKESFLSID